MKDSKFILAPEHTALRVALWRALHVEIDPPPHVFVDVIGAELANENNWRSRADMDPNFSRQMRASIVGRARFVEDLVEEFSGKGVDQYVILGAGLDTFAVRRKDLAGRLHIFEVDQPGPQEWKKQRLEQIGLPIPPNLHFVPVDFEAGESWWELLVSAGFNSKRPAIIVSTGVSMYLEKNTNFMTFQQMAKLSQGSVFATTFLLSLDLLEEKERTTMKFVMKKAAEAGTPFLSLFNPGEITSLAQKAGFSLVKYVSADELYRSYFSQRDDGLSAGRAEGFLLGYT